MVSDSQYPDVGRVLIGADSPKGGVWVHFPDVVAPFEVMLRLDEREQRVHIAEFRVAPKQPNVRIEVPEGGVTSTLLRRVRLTELRAAAVTKLLSLAGTPEAPSFHLSIFEHESDGLAAAVHHRPTSRRTERTPLWKARLAARYVELSNIDGKPYRPLTEEFHLADKTIRDAIRECRKQGYLTDGQPGVASGALTRLAIGLLQQNL
jgi:hypothetical protein